MTNEYINISKNRSSIVITAPKYFRNKIWGEKFGGLYEFFENEKFILQLKKLEINLFGCVWADPIPLISLFVLINQRAKISKQNIVFILPSVTSSVLSEESKIFLKFLKQEGYLDIIKEVGVIKNEPDEIDIKIERLIVSLNYFDCHLFDAKVFNTISTHESDAEFYKVLNDFIDEISINLKNKKLPIRRYQDIIFRIRTFLAETINNVYQHAYIDERDKCYVGVYVRYRYGLQNDTIAKIEKDKLKKLAHLELNNSPRVSYGLNEIIETKEGFVEVFVIDVGQGIAASTGKREPKMKIKHPTRVAFLDIFNTEQRKSISSEKNETEIRGLEYIGKLIEQEKDFILNKDREDWLGGIMPDLKNGGYFESVFGTNIHTRGCIWQASLSWHSQKNITGDWENLPTSAIRLLNLYKSEQVSTELLRNYIIIDERIIHHPSWNERNNFIKNHFNERKDVNTVIYLPQEGVTKHLLGFVLLRYISESCNPNTNLIIADIPDEECSTYSAALISARYNVQFRELLTKIPYIILISKSLSICALSFADNNYQKDTRFLNQFINDDLSSLSLYKILEVLITFDSLTIWQDVIKNNVHAFINAEVLWDKIQDKPEKYDTIDGYLDFNQICEVPAFIKLFEIGLQRISGLFKNYFLSVSNLDILTENICNRFQANLFDSSVGNNLTFLIGSVLVKGFTQEEGFYKTNSKNIALHCFHHPSSNANPILKLFYWPKKSWIDYHFPPITDKVFKRIGRTHAISEGGWLAYEVPRYDADNESFYQAKPNKSYEMWQNTKLGLSIGNFRYGNYADLLKIDMRTVIDNAFYFKDDLAKYLVSHIFYAVGGYKKDQLLDKDYWGYIEKYNHSRRYANIAMVVYPNHFYANYLFEHLTSIIVQELFDKVVSLNYVRNNHSKTNLLFSPLSFPRIKELLSADKNEVLFFDDAVITGRTRKEVKHLAFFLGAREIKSLAILDRQRLPYSTPNRRTNSFYWRLDIPRLGYFDNNPISNALSKAIDFKEKIIPEVKSRINVWEKNWSNKLVTISNYSNFLSPVSVKLDKPLKKFGVRQNLSTNSFEQIGGDSNEIYIHTSIGLIVYCLEMHCITGRDDLALKYCKEDIQDTVKIELICSYILLYGSEIRPSLKHELLEKLIEVSGYSGYDNYSILASLTILSLSQNEFKKLSCINAIKSNSNLDILIAFAIQSLVYNSAIEGFESYHNLINVTAEKSTRRLLRRLDFHRQIYNKRSAHVSPIHAVINQRKSLEKRFFDFDVTLKKLRGHISDFSQEVFPSTITKVRLLENIEYLKYQVIDFFNSLKDESHESAQTIQSRIEIYIEPNLLVHLEQIHSNLFLQVNNEIKPLIRELFSEFSTEEWLEIAKEKKCIPFIEENKDGDFINHQISISATGIETLQELETKEYSALWVPFDDEIKYHIKNFITNYLHGTYELFVDPFGFNGKIPLAHFWYTFEVDLDNFQFTIKFANSIDREKNCKENAENSPYISQINNLLQLGCCVSFSEIEVDSTLVLITQFSLPII